MILVALAAHICRGPAMLGNLRERGGPMPLKGALIHPVEKLAQHPDLQQRHSRGGCNLAAQLLPNAYPQAAARWWRQFVTPAGGNLLRPARSPCERRIRCRARPAMPRPARRTAAAARTTLPASSA